MRNAVDYRKLNLRNITSPEFRHIFLLFFWPLFFLLFLALEQVTGVEYHVIYSPVDDLIPFCEWFLIPYLFWFVFMLGTLIYTFFFDVEMFRRYMWFIILTYGATLMIYVVYPNCQNLRPASFERDNVLTRFMADYYAYDTNTNVCPSLHVIGAVAAMLTGLRCKGLNKPGWKAAYIIICAAITASTVFLKQHSVLDIPSAFAVCVVFYYPAYLSELPVKSMTKVKKKIKSKRYAA